MSMSIPEQINLMLKDFTEATGVIGTFVVDLKANRSQFSYPEDSAAKDIAIATAFSIGQFQKKMQVLAEPLVIQNMEVETSKDKMILAMRITDTFIFCVICPISEDGTSASGWIRTVFDRRKDELSKLLNA